MTATLHLRRQQLTKIRTWCGLTKDSDLAIAMGVDAGNLSRVLSGKQQPSGRFIASLCKALNAELDDLFEIVGATDDVAV